MTHDVLCIQASKDGEEFTFQMNADLRGEMESWMEPLCVKGAVRGGAWEEGGQEPADLIP